MTFISFHHQPLRHILAEVVEINRRNNNVAYRAPIASAAPIKVVPKASAKKTQKKQACKYYRSPRGCRYKNCRFLHQDLPSEVPETLPVVKAIVWKGNPRLSDETFRNNYILQHFGWGSPTKKQGIEWFQQMHSDGHLKYFTYDQLLDWAYSLNIQTREDFLIYIGSLPDIFHQFRQVTQHEIAKLKADDDSEKAKPKYDTFHCFDALPTELRLKIWGFAVRTGRQLIVKPNFHTVHTTGGPGIFFRKSSPSPLWLANKESEEASSRDTTCSFLFGCDMFSATFDTLFLSHSAADLHLCASNVPSWGGDVVQRVSLTYYKVCNVKKLIDLAKDLFVAFPVAIRIEFWLSDSAKHSAKYLPKSAAVMEKATAAINEAYQGRIGMAPPRVRLITVPEARAIELDINDGFW
ncbi:hypothetical protein SBOR_7187 [Sclerotinia borealis F-4128]|uniref:C3H1-type domain-containing protein n=1 Tax=Sclerotinia borealis (strain F-4128) TaxID=1432307 RepID=W9C9G0_SCLBF|nr:hypothetical protein SBOR_7187 [Sclerotinia borealis F-4128]